MLAGLDKPNALGAGFLFAAAMAWPEIMSRLSQLLATPLQRATHDAWCGAPIHAQAELLGHCPACWAGAALLASLGAFLLMAAMRTRPSAAAARD